jgi:hypothetical protein
MMDERSRLWPVFLEIRDSVKAVLAPALPIRKLLRRGRHIARRLRQTPRHRPLQRSKLKRIFERSLG